MLKLGLGGIKPISLLPQSELLEGALIHGFITAGLAQRVCTVSVSEGEQPEEAGPPCSLAAAASGAAGVNWGTCDQ